MSKPPGLDLMLNVVRSTPAQDKIWDAVEWAIVENMSVNDFIGEAREAWEYELSKKKEYADDDFKKALKL